MSDLIKAPELQIQEWLNADSLETGSHSLSAYAGKVVFITAFQPVSWATLRRLALSLRNPTRDIQTLYNL